MSGSHAERREFAFQLFEIRILCNPVVDERTKYHEILLLAEEPKLVEKSSVPITAPSYQQHQARHSRRSLHHPPSFHPHP